MDRERDPLKIPEILGAVFDAEFTERYPTLASACGVDKYWCSLARERLFAKIDLSVVLRLLPRDAWYIYDVSHRYHFRECSTSNWCSGPGRRT